MGGGGGGGGAAVVVGATVVVVVAVVVVEAVVDVVDVVVGSGSEVAVGAERPVASAARPCSAVTIPTIVRTRNVASPPAATASHGHRDGRAGATGGGAAHGDPPVDPGDEAAPQSCSGGYHFPSAP